MKLNEEIRYPVQMFLIIKAILLKNKDKYKLCRIILFLCVFVFILSEY